MSKMSSFGKITLIFVSLFLLPSMAMAADGLMYDVTITNLTKGQPFSPTVVAIHRPQMTPFFVLGEPASEGIWSIAEGGNTGPLEAQLAADPNVYDFKVTDGPFLPGESVTVTLMGNPGFGGQRLSLAGMLGSTNDAFFSINGQPIPSLLPFFREEWTDVFTASAYDSGTEVNSESCEFVPGPPCMGSMKRDTDGAEGYVYVHSGIHGIADLPAAELDWNNPVAKITLHVHR